MMKSYLLRSSIYLGLVVFIFSGVVYAETYSLIITGSGGVDEYEQKFLEWGQGLKQALVQVCGHDEESIILLSEIALSPKETSTLQNIKNHLDLIYSKITDDDTLFIYLIGHGSYLGQTSKFHLPGDDLTAEHLKDWLEESPTKQQVILNTASSSAGFINVLSQQGRVICTATRNTEQKQATEFMGQFIIAMNEGSADLNFDERITVFEACVQASKLTDNWYNQNGYIITENAILDDNGDGLGTRLTELDPSNLTPSNLKPSNEEASDSKSVDGRLADSIFLKKYSFPENTPEFLINTYLSLIDKVESIKSNKEFMDTQYQNRLESLLLDIAYTHKLIRQLPDKKNDQSNRFEDVDAIDFSQS